ncbi:MAG: hypothetical protein Ct9H90mP2_10440 [Dehalococcoidia bacterium]|nr:MAG: hypothetical protein Ct9H90mP2_10440 [Dehalococcoidia bacterium]
MRRTGHTSFFCTAFLNAPNTIIQETVRAFNNTWYRDIANNFQNKKWLCSCHYRIGVWKQTFKFFSRKSRNNKKKKITIKKTGGIKKTKIADAIQLFNCPGPKTQTVCKLQKRDYGL